mmetsp:Transcript_99531/g.278064  ORF Transcript_99531/g.278064 Transcript_99531/m.278064 type:complete len:264 (+) Transcript_99531:472-1263(+)
MLAAFCGDSSHRLLITTSTMAVQSGTWWRPTVANDHTVFESSCGLKVHRRSWPNATSASPWNSGASTERFFAYAQRVLAISCGFASAALEKISTARFPNMAPCFCFAVAKDQAMMERHCRLNSPGARSIMRLATWTKSWGTSMCSLAYAQTMFESSKGFNCESRGAAMPEMRESSCSSGSLSVAQDQQTMLMHWTSKGTCVCRLSSSRRAEPSICCLMVLKSCLKLGFSSNISGEYPPWPDTASLVTRCSAVTKLIAFISVMW